MSRVTNPFQRWFCADGPAPRTGEHTVPAGQSVATSRQPATGARRMGGCLLNGAVAATASSGGVEIVVRWEQLGQGSDTGHCGLLSPRGLSAVKDTMPARSSRVRRAQTPATVGPGPGRRGGQRDAELVALRVEHHDVAEVLAVGLLADDASPRRRRARQPWPGSVARVRPGPGRLAGQPDVDVHPVLRRLRFGHLEEADRRTQAVRVDDRRTELVLVARLGDVAEGQRPERPRAGGGQRRRTQSSEWPSPDPWGRPRQFDLCMAGAPCEAPAPR